ncbi:transcriptional regulator [Neokomagataea thailandica NBRC 106555]|uniref:PLP-dependent aminotransferase family protein n=2 Tax=Neokomagataea TaxID=1223423 RepID=A0A4Y6V855_9PROT|nr:MULTISPECIES: PLP-dependent aminotransferase family protein [Neokomagataea]QDH25058.1 PLP-dependent aminotransferase family protein [Neokomagataea tanensis]GBR51347.1 transcriptional regulator [Neokomagataea thailandica NBRC 106555]
MDDLPWLTLNFASDITLEQQIHDALRGGILAGKLRAGDVLPSTRALAASFGVARSTVIRSYDRLRAAGYVVGQSGSATRVADLPSLDTGGDGEGDTAENALVPQLMHGLKVRPFAPGVPDISNFPSKVWARYLGARARNLRLHDLGYSEANGIYALRSAIIEHVTRSRAVHADAERVIIMPSAAAIIDFLASLVLGARKAVWVEEPGYVKAREILQARGAEIIPVPCDEEGIILPDSGVEEPALIYVTPSHQYPTGVTMSLPRRLQLLEAAKRFDAVIIEDDYDSEFHYSGRPVASLQGIDQHMRVAYVGTFSKTLAPGVRVAYAILPPWIMERASAAIHRGGGAVPIHVQAALADFIRDGHFRAHVRRMKALYEVRMKAAREVMSAYFDVGAGGGGLQFAAYCRDQRIDEKDLVAFLNARNIAVRALSNFYIGEDRHGLVVGIANIGQKELQKFIKEMKDLYSDKI